MGKRIDILRNRLLSGLSWWGEWEFKPWHCIQGQINTLALHEAPMHFKVVGNITRYYCQQRQTGWVNKQSMYMRCLWISVVMLFNCTQFGQSGSWFSISVNRVSESLSIYSTNRRQHFHFFQDSLPYLNMTDQMLHLVSLLSKSILVFCL